MGTRLPLGPYLLGQRLARGGMGEVFLATRQSLGGFQKPLVVKLLLPHLAEKQSHIQMFLDEARLAARMSHPNVAQIFDVGVEGGRYYLVMELVRGVALSRLIARLRPAGRTLPESVLVYVGRALCDGLHHAHERRGDDGKPLGVVHRDVTPHNVLLSVEGEVKLTDFGIAKVRDGNSATQPGHVMGKLEFLAREQLLGEALDRRVDLFGAGLTLYQLATLRSPFRRESDAATMDAVKRGEIPSLAAARPDLSPQLVRAIEAALEADRERRPPTALELRRMLPPDAGEGAEALGALVRELCDDEVESLDRGLAATGLHPNGGTSSLRTPSLTGSSPEDARTTTEPVEAPASNDSAPVPKGPPTVSMGPVVVGPRDAATVPEQRAVPATGVVGAARAFATDASGMRPRRPARTASIVVGVSVAALFAAAALVVARHREEGPPGVSTPEAERAGVDGPVARPAQPSPAAGGLAPVTTAGPRPPPSPEAEPALATPPAAEPAPTPSADPELAPLARATPDPRPPKPAAKKRSFLTVDAVPWAEVRVNGKLLGDTPLFKREVPAGTLTVEMRNPDTGKQQTRRLSLAAGETQSLKVDLR